MSPLNAPQDRSEQPASYDPVVLKLLIDAAFAQGKQSILGALTKYEALRLWHIYHTMSSHCDQAHERIRPYDVNILYKLTTLFSGESAKALQDDPVEPSKATEGSPHDPKHNASTNPGEGLAGSSGQPLTSISEAFEAGWYDATDAQMWCGDGPRPPMTPDDAFTAYLERRPK